MRTIFLFLLPMAWVLEGCSGSVNHYFSHKEGTPEVALNAHAGEVGSTGLTATDDPRGSSRYDDGYQSAVDVDTDGDGIAGNEDSNGNTGGGTGSASAPAPAPSPVIKCPRSYTLKTIDAHVILLESSDIGLSGQGNAELDVHGNILVSSTSQEAIKLTANAKVSAQHVYLAGFASIANHATLLMDGFHGAQPIEDPLQFLPAPDPSGLAVQSDSTLEIDNGSVTLSPGVYRGGLEIAGNARVNLEAGLYYFIDGGLRIAGNGHLAGSEISMYFADTQGSPIAFSGNGALALTPPAQGPLQGITFFVNRDNHDDFTLVGNACMNVYGAIYARGSEVHLTGNGSMIAASQVISNSLRISGNSSSRITYTSPAGTVVRPLGCFTN